MNDKDVTGWSDVIEWFGYSPTFHDAEVESLDLRRGADPSILRVHAWRTTDEIDQSGYYRQDRHAVVSFILSGLTRQELSGWNNQNVLASLRVLKTDEGYEVTLDATHGVEGVLLARELQVEVRSAPNL